MCCTKFRKITRACKYMVVYNIHANTYRYDIAEDMTCLLVV